MGTRPGGNAGPRALGPAFMPGDNTQRSRCEPGSPGFSMVVCKRRWWSTAIHNAYCEQDEPEFSCGHQKRTSEIITR